MNQASRVSAEPSALRRKVRKEVGLLAGLLFLGLVVMPVVVFLTGQAVFGSYGGHGYGDFFGAISEKVRTGDRVAWFLVLAPYLIWQSLRLMAAAWRRLGRTAPSAD